MDDFLIRQLGKDSIDEQVALFARSFGHEPEDLDKLKNAWVWKHYRNPVGDSIIFGAFAGGKMVGINAFMPMEYRLKGQTVNVVQSCESGVDPDFRRRGIWGSIIKCAMDCFSHETSYDAMIGFPNYHNSYPGFVKLGWTPVLSLNNLVMINSGRRIAERYLPAPLAAVGGVASVQKAPLALISKLLGDYTAGLTREEPPCPPVQTGVLSLHCSREWLSWKASYKNFQNYAVRRGGENIADFAFQEGRLGSLKYLHFVFGVSHTDDKFYRAALAACFLSLSQRKDVALIRLMCAHPSEYRGFGFANIRSHHNPFIVYPLNCERKDILLNPSLWKIGPLDLD